MIFRSVLEEKTEDVEIGRKNINAIRYADDTEMLAESIKDL